LIAIITDLWVNIAVGLRLMLGRPLRYLQWRPRTTTWLLAALASFFVIALSDYSVTGPNARFNHYALISLAALLGYWLLVSVLFSASESAFEKLPALLSAAGVVFFWYLLFVALITMYLHSASSAYPGSLRSWLTFYGVSVGLAVLRTVYETVRWRSVALLLVSVVGIHVLSALWYFSPPRFYVPLDQNYARFLAVDEESVYFRQADLLAQKLSGLAQNRPQEAELYFVGFAGNGDEPVFASEVSYVRRVIQREYLADASYAVQLASSFDSLASEPLANVYNLERVLHAVAGKMDVSDDVLMLFLTSHGSKNGSIDVSLTPLNLRALDAESLRDVLDSAGIQWRIIVVSACYSGSFIEALKNDNTIIVTAASAERTSFGCSSDRDLTYFGEALFRDALASEPDFLMAVESARKIVTAREIEEKLEPSEPQLIVGAGMLRKLQSMGLTAP